MENAGSAPAAPDRSVFVLGGNNGTLAFVSSLRPAKGPITTWLVPLAWTPIGVVLGDAWQRVGIAANNVAGWVDQTFPADDDHAFVTPVRDLEMLQRVGWHAELGERLNEGALVNPEDVPEDVLEGIANAPRPLVQCAACRRACVRGDFVWNERELCAWDYHSSVFGRRGPWRNAPYEERLFETLPRAAYVVPELVAQANVDLVLMTSLLPAEVTQGLVNAAIASDASAAYMAVRSEDGLTLLRERSSGEQPRSSGEQPPPA